MDILQNSYQILVDLPLLCKEARPQLPRCPFASPDLSESPDPGEIGRKHRKYNISKGERKMGMGRKTPGFYYNSKIFPRSVSYGTRQKDLPCHERGKYFMKEIKSTPPQLGAGPFRVFKKNIFFIKKILEIWVNFEF